MSQISSDDVRKVAQLARLDLPEDKIATYTGQLESILESWVSSSRWTLKVFRKPPEPWR